MPSRYPGHVPSNTQHGENTDKLDNTSHNNHGQQLLLDPQPSATLRGGFEAASAAPAKAARPSDSVRPHCASCTCNFGFVFRAHKLTGLRFIGASGQHV